MKGFTNQSGSRVVHDMIKTVQQNKQYLSDVDGAIGDGDHGINMSKGFTLCEKELEQNPGDLSYSLKTLSTILMRDIGGSMGPLYGMMFKSMARVCNGKEMIDAEVFSEMLKAAETAVIEMGNAEVGDKTLLDSLVPAVRMFSESADEGKGFAQALDLMKGAAVAGRDSTIEMIANVGRASRLGERSRGFLDPGAVSCCLILCSMADSIKTLIS